MIFVDIKDIKPADYNPRFLSEEAKKNLLESIKNLGFIKPIVLRKEDYRILAGHQRSTILNLLSPDMKIPAFVLENVKSNDEVRFNQYHNAVEKEISADQPIIFCKKEVYDKLPNRTFVKIPYSAFTIQDKGKNLAFVKYICDFVTRYGDFGCGVINTKGRIVISSIYVFASILLKRDTYVYKLESEREDKLAETYFQKEYGVFDYSRIERTTYVQTKAQKHRLTGDLTRSRSRLYDNSVIPYLMAHKNDNLRILDFGAGEMAYATNLRNLGFNIKALEFYPKKLSKKDCAIDTSFVLQCFKKVYDDMVQNGKFDVVICDSVLNSVDSQKAENSVLGTLNFFCKPNWIVFFGGRNVNAVNKRQGEINQKNSVPVYFLDENKLSANLREGHFFFQKFHDDEDIKRICNAFFGSKYNVKKSNSSFFVEIVKEKELPRTQILEALEFEFTLPLPNGRYDLFKYIKNLV